VAKWLATFPNIQVISRDGTAIYSSAATASHPKAVQISDRFHLIKGLSEAINKYIIREFPARVEIPLTGTLSEEMEVLYNTANRPQRIRFAHQKRKEGLTVSDIALLLHSCPATVRKYFAIP
ncbi:MAG: transposase, partial [bacterium]|nr:transposase [bacterium]